MKQEIINFILEMILCYFLLRIQIVCNEEKSTLKTIKCKIVGQWNYSNKFDSVKPHLRKKFDWILLFWARFFVNCAFNLLK